VKILDEFLKGRWLYHDELFGLATNLVYVSGGKKLMNETMEEYNRLGITSYTDNNFKILTYLKVAMYPPQPIHEFSPFEEDQEYHDLISATKDIRGKIDIIQPVERIELAEAESKLKYHFDSILLTGEKGKIYIIKSATGIGKTQLYTSTSGITISIPTHQLKNEVSERMKVKYVTAPDPILFDDDSINQAMERYYLMGLPKKATAILYTIAEHEGTGRYSEHDVQSAKRYLLQLGELTTSNDVVITTHSRTFYSDYTHDTIIYDEDPLNHIIDIKQIQLSDLYQLNIQSKNIFHGELDSTIEYLEKCEPNVIVESPRHIIDLDELVKKATNSYLDSNVFEFFNSTYVMKDSVNSNLIHYVVKRNFPVDKKIIVMSASVPVYIYQQLYGDRVEVIDISDVKQQGSVIQHTKRSCSRNGLNRYVQLISDEVGDNPVITFKSFKHHFKNPVDEIHFGNCSGYDTMKGKNLAVVGTPHRNNVEYMLTGKVLGIDSTDTVMSFQNIDYNGFRFKFNCFDNEELRKIQLALIESDLVQAVGRARTLRTGAQVRLYSNFPLRISERFIY
jgi:hypothetical protein